MSIVAPEQLPQFFTEVVALDADAHEDLKVDSNIGFGFAASAVAILIGLGEFDVAAVHYPIVFTGGDDPLPVAVVGCRSGENLYVRQDGGWDGGAYIPAYVRTYPFLLLEVPTTKELYLGIEPTAKQLDRKHGKPLFEDRKPTSHLTDIMNLCMAYRQALRAAKGFGQELQTLGLLIDKQAEFNFDQGEKARLNGFRVIDRAKFNELPDETVLEWRTKGWLDAAYAHFYSNGRWRFLLERAANTHHSVQ